MPSIWLDVTTIVHWRRPPVGVVRVEAELFRYLASRQDRTVRFCHFDKKFGTYHEIAASYVEDIFNLHGHVPPAAPLSASSGKRAVQHVKGLLSRAPNSIRTPLVDAAKRTEPLLRTALHYSRRATTAFDRTTQQLMHEPPPRQTAPAPQTPFGPGDVLISAGLDWDQKDLVCLYQIKLALGLKVVLFCYDLIPVLLPQLCVGEVSGIFARYFVDVAWCADEVLCISKSSLQDFLNLVRETGAPAPETSVIRLGSNLPPPKHPERTEPPVTGKYLLFVSTIERRKNHEVIYRALVHLVQQGRTDLPKIVFVGMPGWGVSDFLNDLRLDRRVRDRFVILNHVSDSQLNLLYQNATFTLYPSLYEGWGLPLAESLSHGKFCLASNSSSLPEVGGSLVEYIEPWDSRKWAERIAYYLDHPEELRARESAIRENYRATTWNQTGQSVFEVAQRLLWSPPRLTRDATAPLPQGPQAGLVQTFEVDSSQGL